MDTGLKANYNMTIWESFRDKRLIVALVVIVILNVLCYWTYWGNVGYYGDDYASIVSGGAQSIWDGGISITSWLNKEQNRFQPVRLMIFSAVTHIFPEELAFYYIFGLHILNVILFFLLIRKFGVSDYVSFLAASLFSVFGVDKQFQSPSATIAGSTLNTFFIITSLLFLISALESKSNRLKYVMLTASYLSYLALVFSYEVAFPMILTIVYVFMLFNFVYLSQPVYPGKRDYLILLPYFLFLCFYYVVFNLKPSQYSGASIQISPNISIRFLSYSKHLLSVFNHLNDPFHYETLFSLFIFGVFSYFMFKGDGINRWCVAPLSSRRNSLYLFVFGAIWYISSVVLFILNHWAEPTSVMKHHVYLMSARFSVLIVASLSCLYYLLPGFAKKIYNYLIVFVVFPLVLISSINYNFSYGEYFSERTRKLFEMKSLIKESVPNVKEVDAIILNNFLMSDLGYYHMSHWEGALLQWFDFKKHIATGGNIKSFKNGRIAFDAPLTIYGYLHREMTVENRKALILYYDNLKRQLLQYADFIDFENKINVHQTSHRQTRGKEIDQNAPITAILNNIKGDSFVKISFRSIVNPLRISYSAEIAMNEEPVDSFQVENNSIYIDVSKYRSSCKYLYLYINVPSDPELKNGIRSISFSQFSKGFILPLLRSFVIEDENLSRGSSYQIGDKIRWDSGGPVEFINWYDYDSVNLWAKGDTGRVAIRLGDLCQEEGMYDLVLVGCAFEKQEIDVFINSTHVHRIHADWGIEAKISFDGRLLKPNAVNVIEFKIPGARKPDDRHPRTLGFALKELQITHSGFGKFGYSFWKRVRHDDDSTVDHVDWYGPEPKHRWAKGSHSELRFAIGSLIPDITQYNLILEGRSNGAQEVIVSFNGSKIGQLSLSSGYVKSLIQFDVSILRANCLNSICFDIPGAKKVGGGDPRVLGFALQSFIIEPVFPGKGSMELLEE